MIGIFIWLSSMAILSCQHNTEVNFESRDHQIIPIKELIAFTPEINDKYSVVAMIYPPENHKFDNTIQTDKFVKSKPTQPTPKDKPAKAKVIVDQNKEKSSPSQRKAQPVPTPYRNVPQINDQYKATEEVYHKEERYPFQRFEKTIASDEFVKKLEKAYPMNNIREDTQGKPRQSSDSKNQDSLSNLQGRKHKQIERNGEKSQPIETPQQVTPDIKWKLEETYEIPAIHQENRGQPSDKEKPMQADKKQGKPDTTKKEKSFEGLPNPGMVSDKDLLKRIPTIQQYVQKDHEMSGLLKYLILAMFVMAAVVVLAKKDSNKKNYQSLDNPSGNAANTDLFS